MSHAKVAVVFGPMGAGKSTVINELLKRHPDWGVVNSYTTRPPRTTEGTAKKYTFVTPDEFMRLVKEGDIVEYEVVGGCFYGTSATSLRDAMAASPVVVMDLQLKGVRALKERFPELIDIYLRASLREVRRRLAADARRKNTPRRIILSRLAAVVAMNRRARRFSHVVDSIPGDITATVDAVERVILDGHS